MSDVKEGGCQCGAVRYRMEGEPLALAVCHCTECQRQSGSAFGMSLIVPKTGFRVTGVLKEFSRTAASGREVKCFFCPTCGTRIYHQPVMLKDSVNIKPGTLDDTSWLAPKIQAWTKSKQPWTPVVDGVPSFEEQP